MKHLALAMTINMTFITFVFGVFLSASPVLAAADWELVKKHEDEEGGPIEVWRRHHGGSEVLEFRGQGHVAAGMAQVMTLLTDPDRVLEWTEGSVEAKLLKKNYSLDDPQLLTESVLSELFHIQYLVHGLPFPFENRDVILKGRVRYYADPIEGHKGAMIQARSIQWEQLAPQESRTRMPLVVNDIDVRYVSEQKTWIDFKVQADPGGMIPSWLSNLAAETIPYKTIQNIRGMVKKGEYDAKRMRLVNHHIAKISRKLKGGVAAERESAPLKL